MKDPHIRRLLRETELAKHIADDHTKVVEELKLPVAKARIDMAVINGHFHGYEIKSASDSLVRLNAQMEAYQKVFDYISVVTEQKHYLKIKKAIPASTGILLCDENGGMFEAKAAKLNKKRDGFYIAKLLRKRELNEVFKQLLLRENLACRSWQLCEILASEIDTDVLAGAVREILKKRTNWKNT